MLTSTPASSLNHRSQPLGIPPRFSKERTDSRPGRMRNGTQFAGMVIGALGVAIGLRGLYDSDSAAMMVLGAFGAVAGLVLIFRGHYQGR